MDVIRRYFTIAVAFGLIVLFTACSDGSSTPSGLEGDSANPAQCDDDDDAGEDDDDDDDAGGEDEDEPGDVDCEDDDD